MKNKKIYLSFFLIVALSCSESKKTKQNNEVKSEIKTPKKHSKKTYVIDTNINEIAQTIGGFENNIFSNENYMSLVEKKYLRFNNSKLQPINSWIKENLNISKKNQRKTLFYPFAGADFIYANSFFPHLDNYIMVGLEPPGEVPKLKELSKQELSKYCNDVLKSLSANMRVGFFLTKRMAIEFNKVKVDGTIHSILFYVARTGHKIIDIKHFNFSNDGKLIFTSNAKKSDGFEIQVIDKEKKMKKIYYCSFNLHNSNEELENKLFKWVDSFGGHYTMLKAASYLNHKSYFSKTRNFILNKSSVVLQDDSGIPFKFFDDTKWNTNLYGDYKKVISLFSNMLQKDLKLSYQNKTKVVSSKLPFRIGYNVQVGNTNLQVSYKKN